MRELHAQGMVVGDRLDQFELLEYVGGGGMGAVFRARDTTLDREVALKVLSPAQSADEETRRRFNVEAQSAARLDHPNIARVYCVGEAQGLNYIVFEFIRGVNIRDLVETEGKLPLARAISYTLQVAEALAHASRRNVVHRDIKPSNIIVTEDGRAKLVDMGLARLHRRSADDDLTASGVTLGTFDYISPEQARDPRTADVRSDIYSLGCTLYYMLTGQPPFPEGTVLQKLLQHQGDEPPDPRQFTPSLPADATALVRRMLAKDPRRRFQDPGELIVDLLVIADRYGISTGVPSDLVWGLRRTPTSAALRRHLPWALPVAALLVIVAALNVTSPAPNALIGDVGSGPPSRSQASADSDAGATSSAPGGRGAAKAVPPPATAATGSPPREPTAQADEITAKSGGDVAQPTPLRTADRGLDDSDDSIRESAAARLEDRPIFSGLTVADPVAAGLSADDRVPDETSRAVAPSPPPVATASGEEAAAFAIVNAAGGQRRVFPNLRAACGAARSNDIIELQFNGRRDEEPLALANLRITIRAGEGYKPVLVFRPAPLGLAGYARSSIAVAGGRLSLVNLAVELDTRREVGADSWSLFETQRADELRLERCVLTIRNATAKGQDLHPNVAFFQIKAAPGADSMPKMPEPEPDHPVVLHLQDCIARGEAVLVRADEQQPVHLLWENGFLATTGPLLRARGGESIGSPASRIEMSLSHVTALVRGGLCKLEASAEGPHLLDTQLKITNSFLLVGPGVALIEQSGPSRVSMQEQQFDWSGDRNFCQGFVNFWKIVDTQAPTVPRIFTWSEWQAHFGRGDTLLGESTPIWLRPPPADAAVHTLRPADFQLAERSPGEFARFEATDGRPAGMESSQLPSPPPDVEPRDRAAAGAFRSP